MSDITHNGWRVREYWRDGALIGWISRCIDPGTGEDTGSYAASALGPLRFLVKDVSIAEAMAAVESLAPQTEPQSPEKEEEHR
jgi:hypothetical protein